MLLLLLLLLFAVAVAVIVIQYAALDLYYGLAEDRLPQLFTSLNLFLVMGVAVASKFCLWIFCSRVQCLCPAARRHCALRHAGGAGRRPPQRTWPSNAAALVTVSVAVAWHTQAWWVDAAGAILISLVIIGRWLLLIGEQVKKIVGHTAPPEYIQKVRMRFSCVCLRNEVYISVLTSLLCCAILCHVSHLTHVCLVLPCCAVPSHAVSQKVEDLALDHDPRLFVDCTRVYHFGARCEFCLLACLLVCLSACSYHACTML